MNQPLSYQKSSSQLGGVLLRGFCLLGQCLGGCSFLLISRIIAMVKRIKKKEWFLAKMDNKLRLRLGSVNFLCF